MARKKLVEFNMNNILEAAEELFEQKGFDRTSMDEISEKAEYSKSTVYVYFKSKEDLRNHLICKYMEILRDEARKAAGSKGDFRKRFFDFCNRIKMQYDAHPLFFEETQQPISVKALNDPKNAVLKRIYELGEETNEAVADFIRSGIEEGYVRKDIDVYTAVFSMWSSIAAAIEFSRAKADYLKKRFGISSDTYTKKALALLLEGVKA